MGNCCEPETLQSLSLREQTATANPKSNVLASIYSANGINKSNRVAESKLSRDSIGSAHPINDIRFSQSIRHPSLIETPELMEKLNDSQRMDQIYSSKLNIKNSKTVMSSEYSVKPFSFIRDLPSK